MAKVVSEGLLLVLPVESKLLLLTFTEYSEKNIFQIHSCLLYTNIYTNFLSRLGSFYTLIQQEFFTVNSNEAL